MKKLITTAILGLAALNAHADGIPTTVSYSGGGYTTGSFVQLNFDYQSVSSVADSDGSNTLSVGDVITSIGGARAYSGDATIDLADFNAAAALGTTAIDWNSVTGSTPGSAFPGTYGFGSEWIMGVSLDNFTGTFNGTGFDYTAGDVTLFALYSSTNDGTWDSMEELHSYQVTGTTNALGVVSYSSYVSSVTNDYFTTDLTGDTFGTSLANTIPLFGRIFQNNFGNTVLAGLATNGFGGAQSVDIGFTNHDGSIVYSVPEPTSIAMLGLGLLGLAGASRRKAK